MTLPRIVRLAAAAVLLSCFLSQEARAANGDLLSTQNVLAGKTIGGICADTDGTYWAVGETSGKIYHLSSTFALLGDMPNPHGTGSIPNLVITRGIAFRQSTQTLLVMALASGAFKVKELTRAGAPVATGEFTIDTSSFTGVNLFGLAYDVLNDHVWMVDDNNDQIIRVNLSGIPVKDFPFPFDQPRETRLRGTGIAYRQEGVTPYLYITYGDVLTLAPSRIMELTVNGQPTGFEVPLEKVPPETPGEPLRDLGALMVGSIGGKDEALVIGHQGVMHVLERVKSNPLPPTFFRGRVSRTNQVILSWVNHGSGVGGSYPGGISISRDGLPLVSISGTRVEYTDENPPEDQVVTYSVKASNGGPFSPVVKIEVPVGKGGLIDWAPFPGREIYDIARDTRSGEFYVTDKEGGKIFHFDRDLQPLPLVPSPFPHPGGIAFNPNGNNGAGSLMVANSEGNLVRQIDLLGNFIDLQAPVQFGGVTDTPMIGGMAYDTVANLYRCMEMTTHKVVSFDFNGQRREVCTPLDIFTDTGAGDGLAFDPLTGNFHITFEDRTVREMFLNCTLTGFGFEMAGLGQISGEPNFVRGVEISENTLLVCSPAANALFQVLIFPKGGSFIRGDLDRDGELKINDAVIIAEYLFKAGAQPDCLDAADTNDDGELDISDPVYLLFFLFLGGQEPPDPYPTSGSDPTFLDNLEC